MDKAIIIGVYDYIGFHLCLKFLEQGVEVTGVHFATDETDLFLSEKNLLVGRNSNFIEMDIADLATEERLEDAYMFIDYYSSYFQKREKKLISALEKQLLDIKLTSIVSLLPIQMCGERIEHRQTFLPFHDRENMSSFFYLPAIYGPWQPLLFALQQSLYAPNKKIVVSEREWTEDAVYVEDAIDAICSHFEKTGINRYILRSTIKNHWQKLFGAEERIETTKEVKCSFPESETEFIILKAGQTEPEEGIAKQKEHLFRFLGENR